MAETKGKIEHWRMCVKNILKNRAHNAEEDLIKMNWLKAIVHR